MKKILVVGVILLFLGSSLPVFAQSTKNPTIRTLEKARQPEYTIKLTGKMGCNGYYVSPVTITIIGLYNESVYYKLNGGNYLPFIPPVLTVGEDGNYSFEALVVDQDGNQTHLGPVPFHIDQTPPVIVDFSVNNRHGLKIVGTAYDNYSGLDRCEIWIGPYKMFPDFIFQNPSGEQTFGFFLGPSLHLQGINITVVVYDFTGNNASASKPLTFNLNQVHSQKVDFQKLVQPNIIIKKEQLSRLEKSIPCISSPEIKLIIQNIAERLQTHNIVTSSDIVTILKKNHLQNYSVHSGFFNAGGVLGTLVAFPGRVIVNNFAFYYGPVLMGDWSFSMGDVRINGKSIAYGKSSGSFFLGLGRWDIVPEKSTNRGLEGDIIGLYTLVIIING